MQEEIAKEIEETMKSKGLVASPLLSFMSVSHRFARSYFGNFRSSLQVCLSLSRNTGN
jgi:hypothetical protein